MPRVKAATSEANDSFSVTERRLAQLRDTRDEVNKSIFDLEERLRSTLGIGGPPQAAMGRVNR